MTLRDTYSEIKRRAAMVLDDVRAGIHHPPEAVAWALRILGESVNFSRKGQTRVWMESSCFIGAGRNRVSL